MKTVFRCNFARIQAGSMKLRFLREHKTRTTVKARFLLNDFSRHFCIFNFLAACPQGVVLLKEGHF